MKYKKKNKSIKIYCLIYRRTQQYHYRRYNPPPSIRVSPHQWSRTCDIVHGDFYCHFKSGKADKHPFTDGMYFVEFVSLILKSVEPLVVVTDRKPV